MDVKGQMELIVSVEAVTSYRMPECHPELYDGKAFLISIHPYIQLPLLEPIPAAFCGAADLTREWLPPPVTHRTQIELDKHSHVFNFYTKPQAVYNRMILKAAELHQASQPDLEVHLH